MKWHKTTLLTAIVLSCGLAGAQETLKIALSTAATGPVVQYGDMHRAGVRMAVEAINARGGVLGRKIEIVEMDDACNPQQTVDVANRIVGEKINYVLGPLCSGTVAAAAKIYHEHGIVMVASTASSDVLSTYGYKNFFRTIGKDEQQAAAAAAYIVDQIKPKKLAILHENQDYGRALAARVKQDAGAKGFKPVVFEEFAKGGKDFSALIGKLKQEGVDTVYYGGYHPELIVMLKQAQEQGFGARWMGPGGVASPAVRGDWAEGLLVTLPPDTSGAPENAEVAAAFKARQLDPSGSFVMTSYASVQVLADAMNRAKTDDPLKVAEFMHRNEFKTVLGNIRFSPEGNNSNAVFGIFRWHQDASKTAIR